MLAFAFLVISVVCIFGILGQISFCDTLNDEEKDIENILDKYFRIGASGFKAFKADFSGGTLSIREGSILSELIKVVSQPINFLPPSPSLYMDMVEFRMKNLFPFRFQDCLIRILLICGVLCTMIFFATHSDASDELYKTASNGFAISAIAIVATVILLFVRYMWVEKAMNNFSALCEELIVTGLIPAFHEPTNSVLTNAINKFGVAITDMQRSFSSLQVALQTISTTQSDNNEQMQAHAQQLAAVTRDFSDLSAAINTVTDKNSPFVVLLQRVNASETAFTEAIDKLLPHHSAELSEIKGSVELASKCQADMAKLVTETVIAAQAKQSKLHEASLAEIQKLLEGCEQSNQKLLETFTSHLSQASDAVTKGAGDHYAATLGLIKQAVAGLASSLEQHAATQAGKQDAALTKLGSTVEECKGVVLEATSTLSDSSKQFAEQISGTLSEQQKKLSDVVAQVVSVFTTGNEAQREHLAKLVSERISTIDDKLKDMATGESIGTLQGQIGALAKESDLQALQSKLETLPSKQDMEKVAVLADNVPQLVRAGEAVDGFSETLAKIEKNTKTAATKKGFVW